jgi:hypothetical protein
MTLDVLQKATRMGIVEQVKQSSTKKQGNSVKDLITPNLCANVAAVMLPTYQLENRDPMGIS